MSTGGAGATTLTHGHLQTLAVIAFAYEMELSARQHAGKQPRGIGQINRHGTGKRARRQREEKRHDGRHLFTRGPDAKGRQDAHTHSFRYKMCSEGSSWPTLLSQKQNLLGVQKGNSKLRCRLIGMPLFSE